MQLIDTHVHLTNDRLAPAADELLDRARQAGVVRCITVGCDLEDGAEAVRLAGRQAGVYCAVGIHPHEADRQARDFATGLRALAQGDKCVALGEMGLDYYYEHSGRERQQRVFAEQLELARSLGKPVVIHCRDAMDDCVAILEEWGGYETGVVFHCYGGTKAQARPLLDRGCYLSFAGTVTFKKAEETQAAACYCPLDRLLIETDGPFLSPEPKRNIKPNEPALLVHTAAKLAELKQVTLAEIAAATWANSRAVFGLEP